VTSPPTLSTVPGRGSAGRAEIVDGKSQFEFTWHHQYIQERAPTPQGAPSHSYYRYTASTFMCEARLLTSCLSTPSQVVTLSHFLGRGNKTAWSPWQSIPDLTDTPVALTNHPQELSLQSEYMQTLERFVVLMYSKGCGLVKVNEVRLRLFASGKKSLDTLPPTRAAWYQHIHRAILQGTVWSQATLVHMDIPDLQDWGWHKDSSGRWLPFWTTHEDSSKACCILLQCGYVKSCTRNCKCSRADVRCTGLCKCEGGCVNNEETRKYIMYLCDVGPYLID